MTIGSRLTWRALFRRAVSPLFLSGSTQLDTEWPGTWADQAGIYSARIKGPTQSSPRGRVDGPRKFAVMALTVPFAGAVAGRCRVRATHEFASPALDFHQPRCGFHHQICPGSSGNKKRVRNPQGLPQCPQKGRETVSEQNRRSSGGEGTPQMHDHGNERAEATVSRSFNWCPWSNVGRNFGEGPSPMPRLVCSEWSSRTSSIDEAVLYKRPPANCSSPAMSCSSGRGA